MTDDFNRADTGPPFPWEEQQGDWTINSRTVDGVVVFGADHEAVDVFSLGERIARLAAMCDIPDDPTGRLADVQFDLRQIAEELGVDPDVYEATGATEGIVVIRKASP